MPGQSGAFGRLLSQAMDAFLSDPPLAEGWDDGSSEQGVPPNGVLVGADEASDGQLSLARVRAEAGAAGREEAGDANARFLLAAMVELLCGMAEESRARQRRLFVLVSKALVESGLVAPAAFSDELGPIRDRFQLALTHLFVRSKEATSPRRTKRSTPGGPLYSIDTDLLKGNPRAELKLTVNRHALQRFLHSGPGEDFFPSRFRSEYHRLGVLGRGGFGHVFKVASRLDSCLYAVKKIAFDIRDSGLCFRVLREVKLLAGLSHTHIVRYYGAWLEYESAAEDAHFQSSPAGHFRSRKRSEGQPSRSRPFIQELSDESLTNAQPTNGMRRNVSSPSISFVDHSQEASRVHYVSPEESPGASVKELPGASRKGSAKSKEPSGGLLAVATAPAAVDRQASSESSTSTGNGGFFRHQPAKDEPKSFGGWSSADAHSTSVFARGSGSAEGSEGEASFQPPQPLALLQPSGVEDRVRRMLPLTRSLVLFVQMELCSHTLKDYLGRRNSRPPPPGQDDFALVDRAFNERVLRELLQALEHIHDKGLIHRDIKPGNIFLRAGTDEVVLGDFGLACTDGAFGRADQPSTSQAEEGSGGQRHSCGVGTWTYSAPEQLNSGLYDAKVDLFSVGVIAYELYHPFRTTSERFSYRIELRQGILSAEFSRRWPVEAQLIGRLLSPNPVLRPSAKEVLSSSFLASKETHVGTLEAQLACQAQTIADQAAQIQELRRRLARAQSRAQEDE